MDFDLSDFADTPTTSSATGVPRNTYLNDEDISMSGDVNQWACLPAGTFQGAPTSVKKMPPGVYTWQRNPANDALIAVRKDIVIDDLISFEDGIAARILDEIKLFWTLNGKFKDAGFLHRRGYLLYGPQGSGKTSLVHLILAGTIKHDGVVFICDEPEFLVRGLQIFRRIEPERPVTCLFEDMDAIIQSNGEDKILALLDGENQIDKVLNIATTNYPERLDKRLVARPRRFDRVICIGMPDKRMRRAYFEKKLTDADIDKWVAATEGFSFAALAELIISVKCLGNSFDGTVETLKKMTTRKKGPSSEDFNAADQPFGFSAAASDTFGSDMPGPEDDDEDDDAYDDEDC